MIELRRHGEILGELARKSAEAWVNRPPQEQLDELVSLGIIDQEGNVLVSMPYLDSDEVPDDHDRSA